MVSRTLVLQFTAKFLPKCDGALGRWGWMGDSMRWALSNLLLFCCIGAFLAGVALAAASVLG
jgi:hypothetical protein